MFEIRGKMNTAICYASVVEQEAIDQIRRMCDYEFTAGSRIRIMPDVHAGAGCTIGTTMTVTDKVVPNVVGVDIGCGMYTVRLGHAEIDFEKVDEAGNRTEWLVPSAQSNQMEPVLVKLAPGARTEMEFPHSGEEFGYVLSGRLIIHREDKRYEAKAGESFYYKADKEVWIENPYKREASFLWISTPPSF